MNRYLIVYRDLLTGELKDYITGFKYPTLVQAVRLCDATRHKVLSKVLYGFKIKTK